MSPCSKSSQTMEGGFTRLNSLVLRLASWNLHVWLSVARDDLEVQRGALILSQGCWVQLKHDLPLVSKWLPESPTNLILIYFQVKFLLLLTLWLTLLGRREAYKPPELVILASARLEDNIVRLTSVSRRQNQGASFSRNLQNRSISPWDYKYVPRRLISTLLGKIC